MAGELRRCLTRSKIIERVRLPRNGKTAEIVQIATISSKVTCDKSKNAFKSLTPFTQKDTGRARARARCKCGGVNQVANNAK